jgi:hypothetical protein
MLYVAHFSFSKEPVKDPLPESVESEPWYGSCTCVVDAESIDAALEKLKALLHELRNTQDLFDGLHEIYLDACVEIRSLPAGGCLTYYGQHSGKQPSGIFTGMRGVSEEQADVYHFAPEGYREGDEYSDEPFVVFGPSGRKDAGPHAHDL